MNTRQKFLAILSLSCMFMVSAREFRTPLSLYRGYNHYPFPPDSDACWGLSFWGAGLFRETDKAFSDTDGTKQESLAGIFFGQDTFNLLQAFAPGSFSLTNPLLGVINITPRFDYSESAAFFGADFDYGFGCDNEWHTGVRAQLPFRSVKTTLDTCCQLEEAITTFLVRGNELVPDEVNNIGFIQDTFAARLDFLSALPLALNGTAKFVNYADPLTSNHITMGSVDVTDANISHPNPISVIERTDGSVPPLPFSLRFNGPFPSVVTLPFLAADGSGLANNQRAKFSQAINYTPLGANVVNQSHLWVVPTDDGLVSNQTFDVVAPARTIQARLNAVLSSINTSAIDFLAANNINFNTQRNVGLGDLYSEFYLHRDFCRSFLEGILGITFPTGKRVTTPNNLLLVPTGNNGHFEVRGGVMFGWQPCDWFALKLDGFYGGALKRNEKVAASFITTSTVLPIKNIGPTVDASVSWRFFIGDVGLNFMVPCCPNTGFSVVYQPYVKFKDNVDFAQTTAVDLFGVTQPLDSTRIEKRTNQVAHKIIGEIFFEGCNYEVFGGWSTVVAGKNATHDTDWYLGLQIYF